MTGILRKLALAGSIAFAVASPLAAAPISPADQSNYKLREKHDMRDVQTGDFRPHGTLTTQQRESLARQDARSAQKAPAQPNTTLPQHTPN